MVMVMVMVRVRVRRLPGGGGDRIVTLSSCGGLFHLMGERWGLGLGLGKGGFTGQSYRVRIRVKVRVRRLPGSDVCQ